MMQAKKITGININSEFQLLSGRIESTDEGYRIMTPERHYKATRAFSCLVEPRPGDVVLFSVDARQQCHILSIVDRPGASDTALSFPGDVTLDAKRGALNMYAQQGINITSEQGISQVAESYTLATKKALFSVDDLTAVGATLVANIRQLRTIADRVEMIAGHWLQKLTNSFREIEGVDQLKARDSIHTVRNLYSMRSKQAAILARKDIKVDAERIHMG